MNKTFKKFIKNGTSALLVLLMLLSAFNPVFATEVPVPDISEWAAPVLNEGERYGIYPMEWYYDSFRSEISEDRVNTILANIEVKIEQLGLKQQEEFTLVNVDGNRTREDFLNRLYNVIVKYEIPTDENPISYFQENKVIVGTNNGLDLQQPCTTEQAVIFSTRLIENIYNQYDGGGKGFFWKVENDGNKIYLLGSIHVGNSTVYPLNQRLKNAFKESDALIVEANLFDQSGGMEYFIQKAMYQDGTTLKDNLNEDIYKKLLSALEKFNIPEDTFNPFKIWSVANDLNVISISNSQSLEGGAQSANLGIDMYFLSSSLYAQKPINELEGIRYQADLFDGLSKEVQEEYLNAILDSILNPNEDDSTESSKIMEEWLLQWKTGDVEAFKESYSEAAENDDTDDELDEFNNMLFGERDKNMADKIIKMLESEEKNTYFVVVGAGHFVVEDTIIDQLIEKGFNVEIVK